MNYVHSKLCASPSHMMGICAAKRKIWQLNISRKSQAKMAEKNSLRILLILRVFVATKENYF